MTHRRRPLLVRDRIIIAITTITRRLLRLRRRPHIISTHFITEGQDRVQDRIIMEDICPRLVITIIVKDFEGLLRKDFLI